MPQYFEIPKAVANNALKGLELRKEWHRGGTEVGITIARRIVHNFTLDGLLAYNHVRKISQYFPRHQYDNLDQKNPPSNGYIAWLLWGGDAGWRWSRGIVERVEKR